MGFAFPDVTVWFPGYGPLPVVGDCPHFTCPHTATTTLGYGPDQVRNQVWRCDVSYGCGGACRAMVDVAGYGVWVLTSQTAGG